MAQVTNTIVIDGPIDRVFDEVTTTRTWPQWHPATVEVGGVIDRPIQLGDKIYEKARIGGLIFEVQRADARQVHMLLVRRDPMAGLRESELQPQGT